MKLKYPFSGPASSSRPAFLGWTIAVIGLLVLPFVPQMSYILSLLILYFVYASLGVSWNLLTGRLGQVSLGQACFFGMGSYTMCLLYLDGFSPFLGIIAGGLLAAIFAVIISPTFRLRGVYFAIGTFGLAEVTRILMLSWYGVTGGAEGLYLPIPENFTILPYYFLALVMFLGTILGFRLYTGRRTGLALMAIRENEDAAGTLGIDVFKYKLITLMFSAFLVGLTGGVYTYYLTYVNPNNVFGELWSIIPMFMVMLGGTGTNNGPLYGAAFYMILSEILTRTARAPELNMIVFASLIIILILFRPGGLDDLIKKLAH